MPDFVFASDPVAEIVTEDPETGTLIAFGSGGPIILDEFGEESQGGWKHPPRPDRRPEEEGG